MPSWGSKSYAPPAVLSPPGPQFPSLGSGDAAEILLVECTSCIRGEDGPQAPQWFRKQGIPLQVERATGSIFLIAKRGQAATPPHHIWSRGGVGSHLPGEDGEGELGPSVITRPLCLPASG